MPPSSPPPQLPIPSLLHCRHLDSSSPPSPSSRRLSTPPSLSSATTTISTPPLSCRHRHLDSSSPPSFIAAISTSPLLPPLNCRHLHSSLLSSPQPPPQLLPSLYRHRHLHFSPPSLPLPPSTLPLCHSYSFPPSPPQPPPQLLPSLSIVTTTSPPSSPPPSTLPSSCCLVKDLFFPSLGMNPSAHHWVQASSTRGLGLFSFLFSLEEGEAPAPFGEGIMEKKVTKRTAMSPMLWKEREKP